MSASSSLPLFEQSCREILEKLAKDVSPTAAAMRIEAREHLRVLESWKAELPAAEVRSETVSKVVDLHTRVLEYLSNKS